MEKLLSDAEPNIFVIGFRGYGARIGRSHLGCWTPDKSIKMAAPCGIKIFHEIIVFLFLFDHRVASERGYSA